MKVLTPCALCLLYVAAVVGLVPLLGPVASPWSMAALSLFFIWSYQRFAQGRLKVPLIVVFFVTAFFPIAVLFAIGLPVYHSWSSTASSFITAFREHGQFWGLELFIPFLAAVIGALILRRRSNIAVKQDAPQAARPLP